MSRRSNRTPHNGVEHTHRVCRAPRSVAVREDPEPFCEFTGPMSTDGERGTEAPASVSLDSALAELHALCGRIDRSRAKVRELMARIARDLSAAEAIAEGTIDRRSFRTFKLTAYEKGGLLSAAERAELADRRRERAALDHLLHNIRNARDLTPSEEELYLELGRERDREGGAA